MFGGPAGDRTPTKGLQSPCAPIITTSPKFVVDNLSYYTPSTKAKLVRVTRFEHATTWSQTRSST